MTYSLITVHVRAPGGYVSGYWVQDHIGNLESAKETAVRTELANSNKVEIAVVKRVESHYDYHERLINQRTQE